jgi:hypothetical protein
MTVGWRICSSRRRAVRGPKTDAALILEDTLCEHVGSLFDYVDRH